MLKPNNEVFIWAVSLIARSTDDKIFAEMKRSDNTRSIKFALQQPTKLCDKKKEPTEKVELLREAKPEVLETRKCFFSLKGTKVN